MNPETRTLLESTIHHHPVVLFMKGTRQAPQCGFSARVIQMLDSLGAPYETVNVLADPGVREGIKEFSQWPTIPQLYIKSEFIGGCDIVTELFANGELAEKLGAEAPPPPSVSISDRAQQALLAAIEEEGDFVRLEVGPNWEFSLSLGPKQAGDTEITAGKLTLLVDRMSATKANGTHIDCVETQDGQAFKLENPNEPARVKALEPKELKARLDKAEKLLLIDVRTPDEVAIASIQGARRLDEQVFAELATVDKETPLVFMCHSGARSARAAQQFLAEGFRNVSNLVGGIDAWSTEVDAAVPRY